MSRRCTTLPAAAALLAAVLPARPASAVTFPDRPPDRDFYVDGAQLLTAHDANTVDHIANTLLDQEQIPIIVVTIPSLATYGASGVGIEGYARLLFDAWGIGSQDRDFGMLLLVSVGDRKARIELGEGFNHAHDAEAQDVMQSLIVPAFKRGDFSAGIADGVRGMAAMARGLQLPRPTPPKWFFPAVIGGALFLLLLIRSLFKSGRSGWGWGVIAGVGLLLLGVLGALASSGGSSGGFGGGSSGGGGATGSW